MVTLRFTTDLYAHDTVTVRNSIDGWARDVAGTRTEGGWIYQLDEPRYTDGFDFKFFLADPGRWAYGPNLTVPSGASGELDYTDQQVKFQFVVELDPADYLATAGAYTLRSAVTGWGVDLWPTSRSGDLQQWALDWGLYRSPFDCKFVITPGASTPSTGPTWMMGDNITVTPSAGEYHTYRAQHHGPIAFPFRIRLVGTRYAEDSITVRDESNGWRDRVGAYVSGAWQFEIPWTDYFNSSESGRRQVRFKFARGGARMIGPNLTIGPDEPWQGGPYPAAGASYDFDDSTVEF